MCSAVNFRIKLAGIFFCFLGSYLSIKLNNILAFYTVTKNECKIKITYWLLVMINKYQCCYNLRVAPSTKWISSIPRICICRYITDLRPTLNMHPCTYITTYTYSLIYTHTNTHTHNTQYFFIIFLKTILYKIRLL